jgi:Effector Associated Constant Component 1
VTSENTPRERHEIELAVSDQAQLLALHEWLRGQPDVEVMLTAGTPETGEQGALDVLTVLASSSGLVAAIKILPEFIRSRRSGFRIETTVRGERFILQATNVQDLLPIVERLLDD